MKLIKFPSVIPYIMLAFTLAIIDGAMFNFDFFTLIAGFDNARSAFLVFAFGIIVTLSWQAFFDGIAKEVSGKKVNRIYLFAGLSGVLYILFSAAISNEVIHVKTLTKTFDETKSIQVDSTAYKQATADLQYYINRQKKTGKPHPTHIIRAMKNQAREAKNIDLIRGTLESNVKAARSGDNWLAKQIGWLVALMTAFVSLLGAAQKINVGYYKEQSDVMDDMVNAVLMGSPLPCSYDQLAKNLGKSKGQVWKDVQAAVKQRETKRNGVKQNETRMNTLKIGANNGIFTERGGRDAL